MKLPLCVLVLMVGWCGAALAQESASDAQNEAVASLSRQDKIELFKARKQVLANNPDLKTEGDALMKQGQALKSEGSGASQADRMAYLKSAAAHEKKMRAAMLQVDPGLKPVFDQIDQIMKQKMQQRAGGGN